MAEKETISSWCVYWSPADQPGKFVVRRFEGESPTHDYCTGTYIDDVYEWMHKQFPRYGGIGYRLLRHETDHPSILETWI